jgi:hypothetical protein
MSASERIARGTPPRSRTDLNRGLAPLGDGKLPTGSHHRSADRHTGGERFAEVTKRVYVLMLRYRRIWLARPSSEPLGPQRVKPRRHIRHPRSANSSAFDAARHKQSFCRRPRPAMRHSADRRIERIFSTSVGDNGDYMLFPAYKTHQD